MNFLKLEQLVDTMPDRGIPFYELIITRRGKQVFSRSVGRSSKEKNDLYWLYSTTKIITCTAAMQLVEQGKLHLDDAISKYLPAFGTLQVRQSDGTITPCETKLRVEHLFTMTGGLGPDHETAQPVMEAAAVPGAGTLEIVNAMAQVPLYFEPGNRYLYGFCHDVLAAVVEVVSEMRFSEYVQRMILDPLEMSDTGFHPNEEQKNRFAEMFRFDNSNGTSKRISTVNKLILSPNYDSGGAGLFGCASDYIKLITALACDGVAENGYRVLSPSSIAQMECNRLNPVALHDFVNGRLHGYGWGLCGRVHMNPTFSLSGSPVGEFGWDGAAGCFSMVDRKNQIALFYGMLCVAAVHSFAGL